MSKPSLLYRTYLKANRSLGFLEGIPSLDSEQPVVFILGAPRCGSTLYYQALLGAYDFSYLSNLHCRMFGSPWLVEKFKDSRAAYLKDLNFESKFGNTDGWYAPSECGEFWYRFFRRDPQYTELDDVPEANRLKLKRAIQAFTQTSHKPLLIKNLMSTMRLDALVDILPQSRFIMMYRNPIDIAHSMLEARMKQHGSYDVWFSVKPPNLEELQSLPPEEQVVEQIRSIYEIIERTRKQHPNSFYSLNYEDFCNSTDTSLAGLEAFFNKQDIELERADVLPDSFSIRKKIRIDQALYDRLDRYLQQNPIEYAP